MKATTNGSEWGPRNLWRGAFADRRDWPSVINAPQKAAGLHLLTVRPGPVLHVWQDGRELAAIPLTFHAALTLAREILAALAAQSQP